jgi:hypothetical protein
MQELWTRLTEWAQTHLSDWTMIKVYIACAVAGGSVLIGQTGLNLFGLGGADDIDADTDVDAIEGDSDGLHLLSVRALAGFLTFFGLVGWAGTASGWNPLATVLASFASGAAVMVMVALVMRFFSRMASEGNVNPRNAVGKSARVYLRIPARRAGKGKVTVSIQGRSMQFEAVTAGDELPSGSDCRIARMTTDDTFEVEPLDHGEQG